MRISLAFLLLGLTAASFTATEARAQPAYSPGVEIHSAADFYAPLSAYGTWVDAPRYGRCWRPTDVPTGWRPYANGSWEWTDLGWYWVSDEPWSWACYHYGTWVDDPAYGWLWDPGTEWAPSWVVWSESPDYIGWAPCPLEGAAVVPSEFVFVDIHRFHHRIRRDNLVVGDPSIFHRSRVINNVRREVRRVDGVARSVVLDPGPGVDPIQRATGAKFTARPVRELAAQTPVPPSINRNPSAQGRVEVPPAPTGREQPQTPPSPPQIRPQPRTAPPTPTPSTPTPPRVAPTPPTVAPTPPLPAVPREAPLPPTGREPGITPGNEPPRQVVPPPVETPPAPPVIPRPPASPPERERNREP